MQEERRRFWRKDGDDDDDEDRNENRSKVNGKIGKERKKAVPNAA